MVSDSHDAAYQRSLGQTLRELESQVQRLEVDLNEERAGLEGSNAWKQTGVAQLAVMKASFDIATESEPFLPGPDSVLPALLALRRTQRTITESRAFLESQKSTLDGARRQLDEASARAADEAALSEALSARVERLRAELATAERVPPDEAARRQLAALQEEKKRLESESSRLLRVLKRFIHDRLGAFLAAEDLGGPVVGDAMDVDAEVLQGGFTARGAPRKTKKQTREEANSDRRQRRIDEIWGRTDEDGDSRRTTRADDEAEAAATDIQELLEDLLNRLVESDGDSATVYVDLPRESAAARFLVRSKVAQFHPRDATKLRLIDFGKDIDD